MPELKAGNQLAPSFTEWLRGQIARIDRVGDLARCVANDLTWPVDAGYRGMRDHLASPAMKRALRRAWAEFALKDESEQTTFEKAIARLAPQDMVQIIAEKEMETR